MRQRGHRFDDGEFYEEVVNQIGGLNEEQQMQLRNLVDWTEAYEISECEIHGEPTRSRARKTKTRPGRRGALRPSASGATD